MAIVSAAVVFAAAVSSHAADNNKWGLKPGSPELQSAGPLAFGPDGRLYVTTSGGDAQDPMSLSGKVLRLTGTFPMKMSDFKVPPPAPKAFGTIKTSEDVGISFEEIIEAIERMVRLQRRHDRAFSRLLTTDHHRSDGAPGALPGG